MEKYNKNKYPQHHSDVAILGNMCRDISSNKFVGVEYKSGRRCGRFSLIMYDHFWRFHNKLTGLDFVAAMSKERAVHGAETSYSQFYIFDSQEELDNWVKEWRELTWIEDVEKLIPDK